MDTNQETADEQALEIIPNRLYTDKEAARVLRCSARTVQRLRLGKKLQSVRVTAKLSAIRGSQLQSFVERQSRASGS